LLTSVIVAGSIIFPLFLYAVNLIALFALESAIKGFEGAKKWATENNIKEVLEQISIYEKALKDVEDDDEAVQEKFIENIAVLFNPWKRDATNNFRYVIYIVTTYLAFIFPLSTLLYKILYLS
jgi:hypothetical protein